MALSVLMCVRRSVRDLSKHNIVGNVIVSLSVLYLICTSLPCFGQAMTNSGSPPMPGTGHDYLHGASETVNPANGSVSIRIPMPLPKGRGLNIPFGINYNSTVFNAYEAANGPGYLKSSPGWTYPLPTLSYSKLTNTVSGQKCYYYSDYVFTDILGVSNDLYTLVDPFPGGEQICTPKTVLTASSGVIQADITTGLMFAEADGTVYSGAGSIEDRNGNIISIGGTGQTLTTTDTLGRSVFSVTPAPTFPATPPPPPPPDANYRFGATVATVPATVTIPGLATSYGLNAATFAASGFTITWDNTTGVGLDCVAPINPVGGGSFSLLSSLQLPNGQSYQFTYDATYGLLSKMIYPDGAWVSYTWVLNPLSAGGSFHDVPADNNQCTYRYDTPAISQRLVSYDGHHIAQEQDFSYSTTWNGTTGAYWTSKQTTVTTHDLVRGTYFTTVYTYIPTYEHGNACGPFKTDCEIAGEQTITYYQQAVGGPILKTESKTWYSAQELETDQITLDNGLTSLTKYTYGAGDQITEKDEYDYGAGAPGPLLRKTVYNYQSFANTAIFPNLASIFADPCQVITYDGSGDQSAETDTFYDNATSTTPCGTAGTPSVTSAGGASLTGHDETNYSVSATGPRGNKTRESRWVNNGGSVLTTAYAYDETGQVTSMTDANGNITQYSFADDYLSGTGTPPGITNAYVTTITHPTVGSITSHEYFQYAYSDGKLTSSQDDNDKAAGKSTVYTYADSLRRLTETDYPDGGQDKYSYSDMTYSPSVTDTTLISSSLSKTHTTTMDGYRHVVNSQLTSDPEGIDAATASYDGMHQVLQQSTPYRSTSDPTYGVTTNYYDPLGRLCLSVPPDGTSPSLPSGMGCPTSRPARDTFTTYSGNCSTVTDEAGKSRKSCRDGLGRLTQVFEDPAGLNYETDYQYNALGNLLCAVQKGTDTTQFTTCAAAPLTWRPRSFTYDWLSRITSATNPETGTISYSYDGNGNVIQKTSPKPNQTNPATTTNVNFCYDALNRLTSEAYNTAACPPASPVATYTYDQGTNGIGRRTAMTDVPGTAGWTYDLMGRVTSESRGTAGATKTTNYVYNVDGSISTITYPSGRTVNYTYSGAGSVLSVVDPTGPINYVTSATYAPHGELTGYLNGFVSGGFAGITIIDAYNSRLQPVLISAASPTATILSLCYDFHLGTPVNQTPCIFNASTAGNNGNAYQIVNNRDGNRTQNFLYDSLNRIQQAYTNGNSPLATSWGETFGPTATNPGTPPASSGIDPWANLTNRSGVVGKTNSEGLACPANTNNQLTTCSLTYDAAGNVISDGTLNYVYDLENRMTKFVSSSTDIYVYDGDSQRVKKNVGPVTLYWYSATGNVLDETDGTGTLVSEYIYFDGKRIARRDADNSVKYYFSDKLGSASVITSSSGTMPPLAESDYYPFGGELPITTGDSNHYKFTGKERDSESGLDNFGARYFTSNLGRFMTPDWALRPTAVPYATFGDPQTLNLYTYVENEPLNRVDADGHGGPQGGPIAYDPGTLQSNPCGKDDPGGMCAKMKQDAALAEKQAADQAAAQDKPAESVTAPFPIIPEAPAIGKALGAVLDVVGDALGSALGVAIVVFTPTRTMRDEDYLPIQHSGPKAADAAGVTAGGQATDVHGNKLGPSGDTQVDRTKSNTRERARNRALGEGSGAVEHTNPTVGRPHWHPSDAQGNKKPASPHHEYPN